MSPLLRCAVCVLLFVALSCGRSNGTHAPILVGAAVSLQSVLDTVVQMYSHVYPDLRVQVSYAGSGTLRHQIEFGAPIDLYLSASTSYIDSLSNKDLIREKSRRLLASNALTLVMPVRRPPVAGLSDLGLSSITRVAIGDPSVVPAGLYASEVLGRMGLLASLRDKLVLTKSVLQVLVYVRTGVVDAGFVYSSDARSLPPVRTILTLPDSLHGKILYEGVVTTNSAQPDEASRFLAYLSTDTVRTLFVRNGFRGGDLW